ncbi:MAG TPA: aspartate-semialdehyde dehydrogenase [Armatimonadota bacterium]|nr:aspartate-semialdehyde dehydrogenase [Armatimonadota bacterium]
MRVGVVGVGPVGDRIIRVIDERNFPVDGEIIVMATSERMESLGGREFLVRQTAPELFEGLDVVFFAGREGAKGASSEWGQIAIDAGAVIIDNGGDFRMDPNCPLVVPEVNMDHVTSETKLIASPNCSTIQMVVALAPLHRAAGIKRICVSTYQSVSGWGLKAMDEIKRQMGQLVNGEELTFDPSIFTHAIAYEYVPHIDRFDESGYTREELKMIKETRKIMGEPDMQITATTVRVPVIVGHGESINVQFENEMDAEKALEILRDPEQSEGVAVMDGPATDPNAMGVRGDELEREYPVSRDLEQPELADMVLVGRVRDDETMPNTINLWCVADNLRKGAATNTVQIAEKMRERGLLPG